MVRYLLWLEVAAGALRMRLKSNLAAAKVVSECVGTKVKSAEASLDT